MGFLRATRQVFIRIQGVLHYLWRAVDQDGVVLESWRRAAVIRAQQSAFSNDG